MTESAPRALPASRLALNPIQWMASDDGWLDPTKAPEPAELAALVKRAGFDGIMAQVPAGWSVGRYTELVEEAGLSLAPGYFVCRSDGTEGTDDALRLAGEVARQHAQLGLSEIGLGLSMGWEAPRVLNPAHGHAEDTGRVAALTALVGKIAEVMRSEGVRPALHPHVGTWIESESEAREVLEALPADDLGFLPDTGHLAWAGAGVAGLVSDYAERIGFVHVKDCRVSVADRGRREGWNYRQAVLAGLWAEPGRGELPLMEILGALPDTFAGWLLVEVDRPDIADPFGSAVSSAEWMRAHFGAGS